MKPLTIVLCVLVVALALIPLLGAYNRPVQWEYANFIYQGPPTVFWRWHSPFEDVEARNLEEMCMKLQIKSTGECRETTLAEIFDFFGARGWELMWLHAETEESFYWFKRPK